MTSTCRTVIPTEDPRLFNKAVRTEISYNRYSGLRSDRALTYGLLPVQSCRSTEYQYRYHTKAVGARYFRNSSEVHGTESKLNAMEVQVYSV